MAGSTDFTWVEPFRLAKKATDKVLDKVESNDLEIQSFIHRMVYHSALGQADECRRAVEEFLDGSIADHFKDVPR